MAADAADKADAGVDLPDAPDTALGRKLKLLSLWHLVGAAVSVMGILLARRSGDIELPWMPRYALQGFFSFAFVAHMASAYGVGARTRWARPLSLAVNYLLTLVAASATLHLFNAFRALGDFGEGLYKAFLPFVVICVGLLWVLLSGQMLAHRPTAAGPLRLRQAGWGLAGVASVWFVIKADPSGFISSIGETLTRPLALGAIALTVCAALATRLMWSRAAAKHFGSTRQVDEALSGLAFLSPNLLGFLIFFAFPLLFSLWVSFFDWDTTNTTRDFIGLENYIRALSLDFANSAQSNAGTEVLKSDYQVLANLDWFGQHWVIGARDVEFWISLKNITVFLVLAVPLAVLPALVLSSVLASKLPGMKVFRTIYFVPSVAGVIGVSIVWGQMFDATIGWINYLLDLIGVSEAGQGQGWLTQPNTALLSMVIVFAWMSFGFNTVLYLAGHQAIPKELYEAAEIDGANTWQVFRRITVPQLRNTTFYVVITTSILALQLFDIVWILARPIAGGPNFATQTPVLTLYQEAFTNNRQGYASALAWVLFIIIFSFTSFQFRRQRSEASAGGVS
ncbi:MAG: sugar ABC transporter permease [Ilumatobacter sp.]|uniref:carbohydrate ABC transporter permease n=2 Tax=Ilumatobacter sp. TaxID=1967498 RepID=UPI002A255E5F|nr:sugar ABC transporter permease [Ilumatobacter sp.]MBT5552961.1 sugar ABC transporter permease [Ilumatobacter sp.]MBT5866307.1 sugar ABC transporter permease [Ilumatobacter sp.]MDG0976107.1 sugar ABC transporter permease [Ilumatobacter sp.]MDG1392334.1 sugar ABC transporter permease [Ilumatobacter sp.]